MRIAAPEAGGRAQAPILVLLHQSPLSSRTYAQVLHPIAAAGIHVVALDTPGFGASTPPPEPWSVDGYAAAVWQVLDRLNLPEVTLLGQHTGATLSVAAALQQPERTRGLILQGLPVYQPEEARERLAAYAPPYRPDVQGSHLAFIWDRLRRMYPQLAPDLATARVQEYLEAGPDYASAYRAVFGYDMAEALARVTVPVHLLYGAEDLVAWMQPRVVHLLGGVAEVRVLDGLTDFAAMEAPDRFATAVVDLMRSR